MGCPAAEALFENYTQSAMEHFEATDKLASLVGQHHQFEGQKELVERAHEKCSAARLALEQHRAQHTCVIREPGKLTAKTRHSELHRNRFDSLPRCKRRGAFYGEEFSQDAGVQRGRTRQWTTVVMPDCSNWANWAAASGRLKR